MFTLTFVPNKHVLATPCQHFLFFFINSLNQYKILVTYHFQLTLHTGCVNVPLKCGSSSWLSTPYTMGNDVRGEREFFSFPLPGHYPTGIIEDPPWMSSNLCLIVWNWIRGHSPCNDAKWLNKNDVDDDDSGVVMHGEFWLDASIIIPLKMNEEKTFDQIIFITCSVATPC